MSNDLASPLRIQLLLRFTLALATIKPTHERECWLLFETRNALAPSVFDSSDR